MKTWFVICIALLFTLPVCNAQVKIKLDGEGQVKTKSNINCKKVKSKTLPPAWAAARGYSNDMHVYFPDYYVFYDPTRGYVYWDKDSWTSSPAIPGYLQAVDWTQARLEILEDITLNEHPELRSNPSYIDRYPAGHVNIAVHVPWQQ